MSEIPDRIRPLKNWRPGSIRVLGVMRSLEDWANAATILAGAVAIAALLFTAFQLRQTAKTSQSQFWLQLRTMMATCDTVHNKLRPEGQWNKDQDGPGDNDWADVEAYMGLLEHCEVMLRKRLIDAETFRTIYRYRMVNILKNDRIVAYKLTYARDDWQNFIRLLERMNLSKQLEEARDRAKRAFPTGLHISS
jgi:hypothetical protein